jgi:hypothetical protein
VVFALCAPAGPALALVPVDLSLMRTALRTLLVVSSLALGLPACATHYIPNTDVEDAGDNRKIVAFCEKYRIAVQTKDIGLLLKLADPSYYEDGGNVDASDDIDYAGLETYLMDKFQGATAIRYEMRYRKVEKAHVEDDRDPKRRHTRDPNRIYVHYTYSGSYRIPTTKGDEWRRRVEDNRLELIPWNDEFRIVAGM